MRSFVLSAVFLSACQMQGSGGLWLDVDAPEVVETQDDATDVDLGPLTCDPVCCAACKVSGGCWVVEASCRAIQQSDCSNSDGCHESHQGCYYSPDLRSCETEH